MRVKGKEEEGLFPVSTEVGHDPFIGQTLGHYRITERIGSGGMGVVYRAQDEHLDREVAIKILRSGTLADESSRRQFHKEALALSKLNHPNIATIHDFDSRQGVDFLVMEYVSGTTLHERLTNGSLPEKEILRLGMQLAEGLDAAHQHGIVHRDLKPSNLRLTNDGRLKILDFGLAKLRQSSQETITAESHGDSMAMAGTLPYMAPEQLLCGDIDARTDIHACGTVLYEMASGRRPWADIPHPELVGAILHLVPKPLSARSSRVSPELERIISKCLEKERENRYQSAKELAIDLRRLGLDSHPSSVAAAMPSPPFLRRPKLRVRTLLLIFIGLLAVAVFWHYHPFPAKVPTTVPPSVAVLPFVDMSPDHDQEYFSDGLAEEILNDLASIPNLRVVGRTSAFQFKGKNEDLRIIGQKLGVANVLEGSVRKDGNHIRVTAQLIKVDDGFHLWSQSYDRDLKDVLALQADVARAITSALQLEMPVIGATSPSRAIRPMNPEAFQAFLQARHFFRMHDPESSRKSLEYINRAVALDPRYAPALALRGEIVLWAGGMAWIDYANALRQGRQDAEQAIALDPDLPDGYRTMSDFQAFADSNCRAAEQPLSHALQLSPADPDSLSRSAMLATCLGRQLEAIRIYQEVLLLDPLRPVEYFHLAENLRDLSRYEEASAALQKALDLNPHDISQIHETWGEVLLAQGRPQEALVEMEKEPPGFSHDLGMALVLHALGRHDESNAALAHLVSTYGGACAFQISQVYGYRGEVEQAFRWLDRAYQLHDPGLMWFKTDLKLNSLRGDPRYAQMLKALNLQE